MMQLSAHARLGKDPRAIQTRTGTPMAVAPAAVSVPIAQSEEQDTVWLDLVAFGRTAELLLRHQQGDLINVMGHVAIRHWTDPAGEQRSGWQLIVEALLSARTTRPGSGRKRTESAGNGPPRRPPPTTDRSPQDGDDFDDDIPF